MYSPKISEEIIPELYRLAKKKGMPMTRLTDELLAEALEKETGFTPACPVRERKRNTSYATYILRTMKQRAKKEEMEEVMSSEG